MSNIAIISQVCAWAPFSVQDTTGPLSQTLLSALGSPITSLAPGRIHTYI